MYQIVMFDNLNIHSCFYLVSYTSVKLGKQWGEKRKKKKKFLGLLGREPV